MFSSLKNHPFAVEAFFDSSLVLSFAVPKAQVRPLVPDCLALDTFDDKWAFLAVAMVQTKSLRPKGFPRLLGNDFFLIGYRIFVRFTNQGGRNLRGLYILKSETDKKMMSFLGNRFTHYSYTTTDIQQTRQSGITTISSNKSAFSIRVDETGGGHFSLPEGSPFAGWKEARRYAGPLPFTFSVNPANRQVLIIEGVRQHWKPVPVKVLDQQFAFIEGLRLTGVRLANAFVIRNVPYFWKKGRVETWN